MIVLLTGCSRGLGAEILRQLLGAGHQVYGISRGRMNNTDRFTWIGADLAQPGLIHSNLLKRLPDELNFDVLIHNAGIGLSNLSIEVPDDQPQMMAVNFDAPHRISSFLLKRAMGRNLPLKIVHISSIAVHVPFKGLSAYAASKSALEAMGRYYALEWGRFGVSVLNLCPDYLDTEMTRSIDESTRNLITQGSSDGAMLSTNQVAGFLLDEISHPKHLWRGESVVLSKRPQLKGKCPGTSWVTP